MNKKSLVVLFTVTLALAGCSQQTDGSPTTATEAPSLPATEQTRATTSTISPPGNPLADADACDMLDDAGKKELGLSGAGEPGKVGRERTCKWRLRGPQDTYIFSVDIADKDGIKDIPASANKVEVPKIGNRETVQTALGGGAGTCSVSMAVTDKSRVSTTVGAGTDKAKACELAYRMAQLIEPSIP
ncbi:hypothetical protein [Alloactinosynnema sp. L-07]|uniref:DUF3558 domain-containing protein n=1 Tax=Alloactinosynnema sp. L-07 TaxID=1653480 RepID=UPI00065EFDDA|nr:DUF3558 domain-containing protein [Alloactinosynnema sp. L-07]CRK59621.1 hypothetical protein [Alloactinosynnema sp. L-07]